MDYRFDEVKKIVLHTVYEYYRKSTTGILLSENDVQNITSEFVSPVFCSTALSALDDVNYVQFDINTGDYNITQNGILDVEADLNSSETFLYRFIYGDSAGTNLDLDDNNNDDTDSWEPLPIDRSRPEYEAVDEALDNAVQVVESDNGYAASEPEERDQIVWSLKQGLEAIRERLPSRSQVKSLIVAPLKFLAEKFATTAIGEAAKAALPKIAAWLASIL